MAAIYEALKVKTTSSRTDQNLVISEFSHSQNVDCHFTFCLQQQSSDSCEEQCNEAQVSKELSMTDRGSFVN